MEQLLALFLRYQVPIYLAGAAARDFLQTGRWGNHKLVEMIALCSRKDLFRLEGISCIATPTRGPVPVALSSGCPREIAYITCAKDEPSPQEALIRALERRLFRIDALALSASGQIVDPFGATEDLASGRIQLLDADPVSVFSKDALALFGVSRLAAQLDAEVSPSLLEAVTAEAGRILFAPRDGWLREISLLLCGNFAARGLQMLYDTRLLGFLLPEVHAMVGFTASSRYHHKELWEHTHQVVSQAEPSPLVRWAALLHDIGKVWTRTYGSQNQVHFYYHEELGAVLTEGIATRFQMDETFGRDLQFLVRNHLRPSAYEPDWTDTAVRRLMREAGSLLEPLLLLSKADMTSKNEIKQQKATQLTTALRQHIEAIERKDNERPSLPKGLGGALSTQFDIPPGPRIGRLRAFLETAIQQGLLEAQQADSYYLDFLQKLPQLPE